MFTKNQLKIINLLNTPEKIKKFIDNLKYNEDDWITIDKVLKKKKAACLEAAILSILILRHHKYEAYLLDLEAVRDEDHVLVVYKEKGKWGSIAKSKYLNLRHREPIYDSIKELAMSYFEHYFNYYGELSLRRFSKPIPIEPLLKKYDWKSLKFVDQTAQKLVDAKHESIIKNTKKKMPKVSPEKFWSEIQVLPKNTKIGKQYEKTKPKKNR